MINIIILSILILVFTLTLFQKNLGTNLKSRSSIALVRSLLTLVLSVPFVLFVKFQTSSISISGWIFMGSAWIIIILWNFFCFKKILEKQNQ
ncbi:MAG: hypothetical protein ACRCTQ_02190 [Brevinemataceae bacterium]